MRNHHHGLPQILIRLAQHVEHDARAFRIEVACRLVGEHDGGAVDERPCKRDPLLLAAGKLIRPMLQTFGDAKHVGDLLKERRIGLAQTGDVNGDLDVRTRAERGQKIEFLKDKSDFALAQPGALAVGKGGEIHAVDGNASRIRAGQSAKQIKERGLAAARRAHDGDELTLLHTE